MTSLPDPEDITTESEALEYAGLLIKQLEQCKKSLDMNLLEELLMCVSRSFFYLDSFLDKICEEYIKKDMINLLYYFLWILNQSHEISDQILDCLYVSLINFTNCSENFAKAVYSSQILNVLIDNCLKEKVIITIADPETFKLMSKTLKVVHNVVRDFGNKLTYKVSEFKKCLVKFIKINDQNFVGVLSMLILSFIIEENETKLLDESSNAISLLLSKVKIACAKENRVVVGFDVWELMHGVKSISCNDNMKRRLVELGGIPLFIDILRVNDDKEVEPTLGTFWNLCFIESIKTRLINEYNIESLIFKYSNHNCEKIKRNYNGIMWQIKNKEEFMLKVEKNEDSLARSATTRFDVFISYAWSNKQQVLQIRDALVTRNYQVWLDDDQMHGSILEAMASGIENSTLFMIGMSSSYMKSPNCRCEAEYAFRIKKRMIPLILELQYKPYSWLGILLGSKVYFEFSERRQPEEVMNQLLISMEKTLENPSKCKELETNSKDEFNSTQATCISNDVHLSAGVKEWNCAQVQEWLEKSKLEHLKKRFVEVNGTLLNVIFQIRWKSPEYFNKTLKKEWGLKFIDIIKFHHALDNLIIE